MHSYTIASLATPRLSSSASYVHPSAHTPLQLSRSVGLTRSSSMVHTHTPHVSQPFGSQPSSQMIHGSQPFGSQPSSQMIHGSQPFGSQPSSQMIHGSQPFGSQPSSQMIHGSQPFTNIQYTHANGGITSPIQSARGDPSSMQSVILLSPSPITHETYILGNPMQNGWMDQGIVPAAGYIPQPTYPAQQPQQSYRSYSHPVAAPQHMVGYTLQEPYLMRGSYSHPLQPYPIHATAQHMHQLQPAKQQTITIAPTTAAQPIQPNSHSAEGAKTRAFTLPSRPLDDASSETQKVDDRHVHFAEATQTIVLEDETNAFDDTSKAEEESVSLQTKVSELEQTVERLQLKIQNMQPVISTTEKIAVEAKPFENTNRAYYLDLSNEEDDLLIPKTAARSIDFSQNGNDHLIQQDQRSSIAKDVSEAGDYAASSASKTSKSGPHPVPTRSSILRANMTAAKMASQAKAPSSTTSSTRPKSANVGKANDGTSQRSARSIAGQAVTVRDTDSIASSRQSKSTNSNTFTSKKSSGETPGYLKTTQAFMARRNAKE
eukprot:TRINITY_DN3895_c0_g1_i3.p1 TRINITY_DN3895_c0_g1~~TRINITY_DN3895_c0_g1_i3.p1  ORF type:complete len:545 (+),score=102.47 TRINITY_DN3895_c0_g1_i3:58-1692(+)